LKNFYQVLGIKQDASQGEIKRAFRRMASLYHPDHNPQAPKEAEEEFKEINEAYEVLGDEAKRGQYDRRFHPRRPPSGEVTMEDFLNWRFTGSEFLEELLREFSAGTVIFHETPRSRPWACGRGRGRRCRPFYSADEK
jgi:DnaJ-class molecular chaperone